MKKIEINSILTFNMLSCSKCSSECVFRDVSKSKEIKELFGGPCDLCGDILCRNCSGISSSEIRALTAQTRVVSYYCAGCLDTIRDAVKCLPNMKRQIAELCTETQELKQKVNSDCVPTYAQVAADTKSLRDQVDKLNETVGKQTPVSGTTPDCSRIEPTLLEMREREKRTKNILVFGLEESKENDASTETDLEKATGVLRRLQDNCQDHNIKVSRIGKPTDGKVRPLRIIFPTPAEAKKILRIKNNLGTEGGVYIKYDQTPMQRAYLKSLLTELDDRKSRGETNLAVKYFNSIPKIIRLQKPTASKN